MKKIFTLLFMFILSVSIVQAKDIDFTIIDAKIDEKYGAIEVVDPVFASNEVTSSITFKEVGDYVIYDITLRNDSDSSYKLVNVTDNNSSDYVKATYEYATTEVQANETVSLKMKVKYENIVKNVDKVELNDFNVILTLEDENGNTGEITINPKTGDNILLYVALLLMLCAGVFLIIKKLKAGKVLVVLSLIMAPLFIFGLQQFKINILIKEIEVIGTFDVFDVVIDSNNGESNETRPITYGQQVGALPTPQKLGYLFAGWYDQSGNPVDENTTITSETSLEARYNIINYSITYDLDGGNATNPETYTVEDEFTLNNPEKEGYTFAGWTEGNETTVRTSVTINKGTTGNKSFTASFSANPDTVYTVSHKRQDMNGEYTIEENETLHGATGTSVTPQVKNYDGFKQPTEQTVEINGNGLTVVTYLYERNKYTFTVNNKDFVETNMADGEFYYETNITVTAKEKTGYTFSKWSYNNNSSNPYTFALSENTTIEPIYTANDNTPYKVLHMRMKVDGSDYELYSEVNATGTTDENVTPSIIEMEGFDNPPLQTVTIKGDGTTVVTYLYDRQQRTLTISNSEYVETTTPSGTYYYETPITLTAQERAGYTFKWSNDSTSNPYSFDLESNTTIGPVYTANENTPYKVLHKTMKVDGSDYELYSEVNATGTTDSNVTVPVLELDGFDSPAPQVVTIKGDGTTVVTYQYVRQQRTLTINNSENVTTETPSGTYYYGTPITLTAKEITGYTFTKWSNNETSNPYSFDLEANTTIEPVYAINSYTVSFNSMGGSDVENITKNYNEPIGAMTIPEYENHNFMGWYTQDGSTMINASTPVTENITYYAHWVEVICKKATSLHSETCYHDSGTSGGTGCHNAGIGQNETLTYGSLPNDNSPSAGDAYDCDVNYDGVYDGTTERFYFIREIGDDENSTAALVYYNNMDGNQTIGSSQIFGYDLGLTILPNSEYWTNPGLVSFGDKVSRLANQTDLVEACGSWTLAESDGYLDTCTYFLENSRYQSNLLGRSAIWIEKIGNKNYRIDTRTRKINTGNESGVRPVIEIPYNTIEGYVAGPKYTISFDSQGGSAVDNITRRENQKIGVLPTPEWNSYLFDGWFTDTNYSEQINSDTQVIKDDTYYAKWTPDVTHVTITPSNLTIDLEVNETAQISVTPVAGMESYTITSTNTSVATFNNNTNTITAKAAGTAYIKVKGLRSNNHIDITVNVSDSNVVTVTFENDGDIYSTKDTTIGGTLSGKMPGDPVKSGYIFVGWFIDGDIDNQFDENTVVNNDLTVQAIWADENSVARIGNAYYETLTEALAAAPTTGEETTVVILRDFTVTNGERPTVISTQNVIIDAGNHILTCGNNNIVYNNDGNVTIMNGTYTCNSSGVATLENNTKGRMYITGGIIEQTRADANGRAAVYNGGKLYISGDAYLSSSATQRATVDNYNNKSILYMSGGTVEQKSASCNRGAVQNRVADAKAYITGGTVISNSTNSAAGGIQNASGATVEIGTSGNGHDKTTPVIRGKIMAVNSPEAFAFYDGVLQGETSITNVSTDQITHETGLVPVTNETVTIGGVTYQTMYYAPEAVSTSYIINLNARGGEISENSKEFTTGASVALNDIPTPTKGIYTFDGWYEDENATTTPVVFPVTLPSTSGETTYYAKWSYVASNEIVNFNMTNDVMTEYYNHIDTWKNDTSTFQTNMDNNFNNYNCSACTGPDYQSCPTPEAGTTLCDQPLGYDTGMNETVNVYNSSETNKEKGTSVSYTTSDTGVIYNMIPGQVYYWELASAPDVHGLVKANGERRTIYSSVRNVRDLGGMSATYTDENGTHTGTIDYGVLYRGGRINNSTDATSLNKLGITEELDLRESNSDTRVGTIYKNTEMLNYRFDRSPEERAAFRVAITTAMQDVVAGETIYFHCKIGTDRTGTLAYFLEGLLGVPQEEKLQDFELSYFYGLLNRTRFHDNISSSQINPRFATMASTYDTNEKIYDWYIDDPDNQADDIDLVNKFRKAIIH